MTNHAPGVLVVLAVVFAAVPGSRPVRWPRRRSRALTLHRRDAYAYGWTCPR